MFAVHSQVFKCVVSKGLKTQHGALDGAVRTQVSDFPPS